MLRSAKTSASHGVQLRYAMPDFSPLGEEAMAHTLGIHRLTVRRLCLFPELDLMEALLFEGLASSYHHTYYSRFYLLPTLLKEWEVKK